MTAQERALVGGNGWSGLVRWCTELLDKELPEYPNLVNDETGKVHCKAVKKLNEKTIYCGLKDDGKLLNTKQETCLLAALEKKQTRSLLM